MKYDSAKAAKALKAEIRKAYPGIKVRATSEIYSGGSSVRVEITDQTPEVFNAIKSMAEKYKYGTFNGMEDLYEYDNVIEGLPQVKYVFVDNTITDTTKQKIWDWMRNKFTGNYKGFPAEYELASQLVDENLGERVNQLVYRYFRGAFQYEEFWGEVA